MHILALPSSIQKINKPFVSFVTGTQNVLKVVKQTKGLPYNHGNPCQ